MNSILSRIAKMSVNFAFVLLLVSMICSVKCASAFNHETYDTETFDDVDFIIVGAGTGGCVMANRLSENPEWKVLLLEVGDEENDLLSSIPLTSAVALATKYNWGYRTEREKKACLDLIDGVCHWPKGRALGGTSVINLMVFNRGHRDDYDRWAGAGNEGWSYHDVLPYFKKLENVGIEELKSSKYRGTKGNVYIQHPAYRSKLFDLFLQAGKDLGYKVNDPNGKNMLGFSQIQAFTRDGKRWSAAKAYLRPSRKRENLVISTRSWVTRILIDPETKVAYGVEYIKNRQRYRVNATKEVILSAGTIASPQLLMLSGVGPAEHLQELQIPVIQNLSVGYNLQDHVGLLGLAFLVNESVTISETSIEGLTAPYRYFVHREGPLTLPGGAEGMAFVKIQNSTLPKDYPDIELIFAPASLNGYLNGASVSLLGLPNEFVDEVYGDIKGTSAFSLVPILMRPKSRGRVSLKSTNPFQWPKMEPNYFEHPEDLKSLIAGVKLAHKLGESSSFQRYNSKLNPRPFPDCKKHAFGSKLYWKCCIQGYTASIQHQVGTCKMGSATDTEAVVNAKLQVYGIGHLRVVDASIMPDIPAAHTNAATFMIGEKAADMVKETWS